MFLCLSMPWQSLLCLNERCESGSEAEASALFFSTEMVCYSSQYCICLKTMLLKPQSNTGWLQYLYVITIRICLSHQCTDINYFNLMKLGTVLGTIKSSLLIQRSYAMMRWSFGPWIMCRRLWELEDLFIYFFWKGQEMVQGKKANSIFGRT